MTKKGWVDFIIFLFMDGILKHSLMLTEVMCLILVLWLVSLVFLLMGAINFLFLLEILIALPSQVEICFSMSMLAIF